VPSVASSDGAFAASNGADFLIGWSNRLFRVSAEGEVLDRTGFAVDRVNDIAGGTSGYIRVRSYLDQILAGAISNEGEVLPMKVVRAANGHQTSMPAVAGGHGRFAVVWAERRAPHPAPWILLAATLDSDAGLLSSPRELGEVESPELDIASTPSGFLIAAKTVVRPSYQLSAIRIDPNLNILRTIVVQQQSHPFGIYGLHVASNGGGAAITWTVPVPTVAAIAEDGTVGPNHHLDSAGYVTSISPHGTGYVLTFNSFPDSVLMQLDSNAMPIANSTSLLHYAAAAASNGQRSIVVWNGADGSRGGLRAGFVAAGGNLTSLPTDSLTRPPVDSATEQTELDSAISDNLMLAVWTELRSPSLQNVVGQLLTHQGQPVSPAFSISDPVERGVRSAVASDGRDFLVAWSENLSIARLAIVKADGSISSRLELRDLRYSAPDVTFTGEHYLVVVATASGIRSIVISRSGELLNTTDYPVGYALNPRVVANGSRAFLAWEASYVFSGRGCFIPEGCTANAVEALRITSRGEPIGEPFPVTQRNVDGMFDIRISLATDGTDYAVVWQDLYRASIARAIVTRDGAVRKLAPVSVPGLSVLTSASDIAWTGREYLLVWSDGTWTTEGDVYLMPMDRDGGGVFPEGAFSIVAASDEPEMTPRIQAGPLGALVFYGRVASERAYGGVARLFQRSTGPIDGRLLPLPPVPQLAEPVGPEAVKVTWLDPNPATERVLIEVSSVDQLWPSYQYETVPDGEFIVPAPGWQRTRFRLRARSSTGISGYSGAIDTYPQPPRRTRKR
jgi:hypothetical protein